MAKRRMTPEQQASEEVEIFAPSLGFTLMRNNNGACYDNTGRLIRYGLGHVSDKDLMKSGDFVGCLQVTITPEMVGKTVPIFVNAEIKPVDFTLKSSYREGTREYKQEAFNEFVRSKGGFGYIVRSPSDLKYYHDYYMNWLKT